MDEDNGTHSASKKDGKLATVEAFASPQNTKYIDLEPETAELARAPASSDMGTTHALKALVDDGTGNHISDKTKAGPSEQKESSLAEVNESSSVQPQVQEVNGDCSRSEGEFSPPSFGDVVGCLPSVSSSVYLWHPRNSCFCLNGISLCDVSYSRYDI